jgi:hypothetical protein
MTRRDGRGPAQRAGPPEGRDEKVCAICGRRIEWRRRWADDWASVRYCSDACRRRRREDTGRLEQAVLALLDQRARGATICPSEVARAEGGEDWQGLMEPVREAARRLVARDEVEITQGGRVVDPSTAKGPIRIRRRARPPA